jgi:uncharacterized FlaG/YvyC family protein
MSVHANARVASEVAANTAQPPGNGIRLHPRVDRENVRIQALTEFNAEQVLPEEREKFKELAKETVEHFDEIVQGLQFDLRYKVDDKTDEVIIMILEKGTDKLIRQVPPEAILKLKQRINDLLGIIYDEIF